MDVVSIVSNGRKRDDTMVFDALDDIVVFVITIKWYSYLFLKRYLWTKPGFPEASMDFGFEFHGM